jgi:DNA-binding MarR family transcriptional regulator
VRRLEERLQEHRLVPIAQYDVLLELNAAPGRHLRMQQLSDRVVLSRSRVSRVVDEMVRAGLVRKEPDPDDRRGSYAAITEDGRAALRKAAPVYLQGIETEFLSHLSPGERRTLERSLTKVLDAQRGVGRGSVD